MFTLDRDLLVHEPNLFRDAIFSGQRLARGTASIGEFLLSASEVDTAFDQTGIAKGDVAVVNGVAYEIMEVNSAIDVTISRLRADRAGGAPICPGAESDAPMHIVSFAPQRWAAHQCILRMAGIETSGPPVPGAPKESMITNPDALIMVECLAALTIIYSALGAGLAADAPVNQRAAMYQRRLECESERVLVHIDMNGDGVPDVVRRLAGGPMVR